MRVGFVDGPGDAPGGAEGGDAADSVDKEVFCKWVELSEPPLGNALGHWWAFLDSGAEGDIGNLRARGDVAADFYEKMLEDCRTLGLVTEPDASLSVAMLARWCGCSLRAVAAGELLLRIQKIPWPDERQHRVHV